MPSYELFSRYPDLESSLPRKALGNWPTPLEPLEHLSDKLQTKTLIKRDDLSHPLYGGNKVRKLEFLLQDVLRRRKKTIITMGGLGSHHIIATAALGREMGLETVGLFLRQPVNDHVRANLLLDSYFGVKMQLVKGYTGLIWEYLKQYFSIWRKEGRSPYFLLPGGSTPLSTLGYINAVLELQTQLKQQGLPDPKAIFVPAGSGGTAAGLMAGIALARMNTVLYGVQVVPPLLLGPSRVKRLARRALSCLLKRGVPPEHVNKKFMEGFYLIRDYLGGGYGFYTPEAEYAISSFKELENIKLEGCYTGKAAAAFLDYCRNNTGDDNRPVIFFNTYSSTHESPKPEDFNNYVQMLPPEFHWCFES